MRGVLDHGPEEVAGGLATHDRAGRESLGEILRAARADELDRIREGGVEHLASRGERGHTGERLGVFLEIEIEAFGPGDAFDEPVESLGGVRDLLGDGHHAFPRAECGVGLIEDPGRSIEEILAGEQLVPLSAGRSSAGRCG